MSPGRRVSNEDYEELLRLMEGGMVDSPNWKMGTTKLMLANMEVQGDASKALVTATDRLVKATETLGRYTLGLGLLTFALVIVGVFQLLGRK